MIHVSDSIAISGNDVFVANGAILTEFNSPQRAGSRDQDAYDFNGPVSIASQATTLSWPTPTALRHRVQ